METKNPSDLLRRVYNIFSLYQYIITTSPESKYVNDDDVIDSKTFLFVSLCNIMKLFETKTNLFDSNFHFGFIIFFVAFLHLVVWIDSDCAPTSSDSAPFVSKLKLDRFSFL